MKRFFLILAAGLACGVVLAVVQRALHLSQAVVWLFLAVIVIGVFVFNFLYVRHYINQVRAALPLMEQNQVRAYIETLEDLRRRVKGRFLKNLVDMDLSVGYLHERRFDEAIDMMETLSERGLKGDWNTVLRLNLCFTYFRTGRYQEGMELYEESRPAFNRARRNSAYLSTLALVEIFVAITEGRYQDAQTQLDEARTTWNTPRSQASYYYLQTLLDEQLKGEE